MFMAIMEDVIGIIPVSAHLNFTECKENRNSHHFAWFGGIQKQKYIILAKNYKFTIYLFIFTLKYSQCLTNSKSRNYKC